MSTPEALALALVQQHLQAALPASMLGSLQPLFERAAAQLDRLGPRDGQRTWMDKVRVLPSGLPTGPVPDVPLEAQVQISEALLGNRQLHVDYQRGAGGLVQSYDVAPLGLLLRGGVRYLVGLVGRGQHRFFALHRIRQAEALPKPARIPAGDTLDAVLARSGGQFGVAPDAQPIGLVLLCSPGLAAVLDESPLSSDQKATPEADGRIRLQATLPAGWELRWWLLAHIEEIEICAPPELRSWAHQALVQAAERHL